MAIPSRLTGSGLAGQAASNICGDVGNSLTAAGSAQTDALQLSAAINVVGTTAASTGVRLPPPELGACIVVKNLGASTLSVYPTTGGIINALAANAAFTIATGVGNQFWCRGGLDWVTI